MGLAPNIPLSVNPPAQPQGPLDMATKGLNVQALINAVQRQKTEQATAELQQQQEQVKTQLMQQNQQDLNAIREMAPKYAKKDANGNGTFDFDGLATEAQSRGVSPTLMNQMRTEHYKLVEAQAKAGSESLANEQAHNKASYEVMEGVRGINDPQERQTSWSTGLNRLKLLGMDTSHLPETAPDDKALSAYEVPLAMHGQQVADAKTLADTNKANAEAAEKDWQKFPELGVLYNTKTQETRQMAGNVQTPAMLESKFLAIEQKKNLGQPLSAEENAFNKSYKTFKELVPAFGIANQINPGGLGPTSGPTPPAGAPQRQLPNPKTVPGGWVSPNGKTLNDVPGPLRGEVQQVLDYRRGDPSITQRGMAGQLINQWVSELDPQHDATTFPVRQQAVKEFEKDANTGNIGAINTALGHSGELWQAAQTLDGSNLPLLHSLQAKFGLATGDDAASTYKLILHRVGPELASAYVKGGGSAGERGSDEADFDISKGQKQIMSNIAESVNLLNSKLDSKRQDWNTAYKPYRDADQFDNRFITPAAKQVLSTLSSQAPTNKGGAKSANVLTAAQVTQIAKDHNISEDEVRKQAAAKGIKVQ